MKKKAINNRYQKSEAQIQREQLQKLIEWVKDKYPLDLIATVFLDLIIDREEKTIILSCIKDKPFIYDEVTRSACVHKLVRTTKNYKPAKKCVECGEIQSKHFA